MAQSGSQQIAALRRRIQEAASEVLKNDVAPVVKEEILDQAQRAYDEYGSEQYIPRGGLVDENNLETLVTDNNELMVFFNYETYDGYNIATLVSEASGYNWGGTVPKRPIMEWTREELLATNKVSDSFRKGLNAKGIKVK